MGARLVVMAAVLLTALLVQTVLLPSVAFAGWRPDLVALTVIGFGLAGGPETGARYGFTAGLAADLLSSGTHVVGVSALVLLTVGWVVGALRPYLSGTEWVGTLMTAVAAGAGGFAAYGLLALLLDLGQFTVASLVQGTLATAGWNLLLGWPVCHGIARLSARLRVPDSTVSGAGGGGRRP